MPNAINKWCSVLSFTHSSGNRFDAWYAPQSSMTASYKRVSFLLEWPVFLLWIQILPTPSPCLHVYSWHTQWDLFKMDTSETKTFVLISEVSIFQGRTLCIYTKLGLGQVSWLTKCSLSGVSFKRGSTVHVRGNIRHPILTNLTLKDLWRDVTSRWTYTLWGYNLYNMSSAVYAIYGSKKKHTC